MTWKNRYTMNRLIKPNELKQGNLLNFVPNGDDKTPAKYCGIFSHREGKQIWCYFKRYSEPASVLSHDIKDYDTSRTYLDSDYDIYIMADKIGN